RRRGAYSNAGDTVVFIAYEARVVRGRIEIGAECQDVRFFDRDQLPRLAFAHDADILRASQGG
ncbi:MAG: DNA mismatch repair protein MutT, partial [Chloroflexi bacterium]|nr:DNA mismatch repair protein MutT [Chloroflexota bacterium]